MIHNSHIEPIKELSETKLSEMLLTNFIKGCPYLDRPVHSALGDVSAHMTYNKLSLGIHKKLRFEIHGTHESPMSLYSSYKPSEIIQSRSRA